MRFQNWTQSAITAEQEKGTSVLNVEFRDTDKQLVLPITEMISKAYQGYSNRGRARELSNLITYLNDQINTIKPQAEEAPALPSTMATPMVWACLMVCPSQAMWPVQASTEMDPPKEQKLQASAAALRLLAQARSRK